MSLLEPTNPRVFGSPEGGGRIQLSSSLWPVLAVGLAVLLLYAPTFWSLAHGLWRDSTHAHGPLVLGAVIWLLARGIRHQLQLTPVDARRPSPSYAAPALIGLGLAAYIIGRSQSLYVLEVGSAIPLLIGLLRLVFGARMVVALWFPIFFIVFLIPLPGSLIDLITHPLKLGVSWASEQLLALLGYPVARAGVILTIGQYQMFVADACAGLTSLFMLEAFGLLYLNVVRHASALRNLILAVLIVPISFASNVLRVMLLCLITFHFGDAAGQGFLHDFSGTVLFGAALMLTVMADSGARVLVHRISPSDRDRAWDDPQAAPSPGFWPRLDSWGGVGAAPRAAVVMLCLSVLAGVAAVRLTPVLHPAQSAGDLERLIPARFGDWRMLDKPLLALNVLDADPGETTMNNPYDQVVMRSYRNERTGVIVDLAVAYGKHQRQEVKIHQPELCFNSQGFRITDRSDTTVSRPHGQAGEPITARNLFSDSELAKLAATYWIRIGKVYADSAWETRWEIFREGLSGRAVDGVLVRATTQVAKSAEAPAAHRLMNGFLSDLLAYGSPELRRALAP